MAPTPYPELQASPRILHTALFAGALFLAPLVIALRLLLPIVDLPLAVPALRIAALVIMVSQAVVVRRARTRIRALAADDDEDAWWNANLVPALVIWAVGEAVVLCGTVFFFLAGDPLMLAMIAGGFLLLFLSRPGRLMRAR
jgi:hypothetical protein